MNSAVHDEFLTVERRRCYSCTGTMVRRGYKRSLLRYLSVFRCDRCRRLFEQETRGFQGFYIGVVLTLLAPLIYALPKATEVLVIEVVMLFTLLFIAAWPVYLNVERSLRARVLNKGAWAGSEGYYRRRTAIGRILCGDCRWRGVMLGIISTLGCAFCTCMLFLSAAAAFVS